MKGTTIIFFGVGLVFALSNTAYAANKLLATPQLEKQNEKTYLADKKQSITRAGDPGFDFRYGMAALRTKHPEEAVFALERVLMAQPNNQKARLELGRAYFALTDINSAKKNFEIVAKRGSATQRAIAELYLKKIQAIRMKSRTKAYVSLSMNNGYDTDINSVTSSSFIPAPNPAGFLLLTPTQTGIGSVFSNEAVAVGFNHRINDTSSANVFANGAIFSRQNYADHRFDYTLFDGIVGIDGKLKTVSLKFPVRIREYEYNTGPDQRIVDITAAAYIPVAKTQTVGISATEEAIDSERAPRGGSLEIIDGSWSIKPSTIPMNLSLIVSKGMGNAQYEIGAFQFRQYWSAALNWDWRGIKNQKPFLALFYSNSQYQGINPTFLVKREDNYYSIQVGWRFRFSRFWAVQPTYTYSYNQSNIPLSTFPKQVIMVSLIFKLES